MIANPDLSKSAMDSPVKISDVADVQVGIVIKPTRYYADGTNGIKAFRSLNIGSMAIKDDDWVYFTEEAMKETQRTVVYTAMCWLFVAEILEQAQLVPAEYDGCNVIDLL